MLVLDGSGRLTRRWKIDTGVRSSLTACFLKRLRDRRRYSVERPTFKWFATYLACFASVDQSGVAICLYSVSL
jgi:hypothetical protein